MREYEAPDSHAQPCTSITVTATEPREAAYGSVTIKRAKGNMSNIDQLTRSDAVKLCAALMQHLKNTRPDRTK